MWLAKVDHALAFAAGDAGCSLRRRRCDYVDQARARGHDGLSRGLRLPLARMSQAAEAAAFLTRNAVDALPEGCLERRLEQAASEGRQLRAKLGLDPTAPIFTSVTRSCSRSCGSFRTSGTGRVLIVGDYTARVGDPSGRSDTRPR